MIITTSKIQLLGSKIYCVYRLLKNIWFTTLIAMHLTLITLIIVHVTFFSAFFYKKIETKPNSLFFSFFPESFTTIPMNTTASEHRANWTITLPSYDVVTLVNCTDDVHDLKKSYLPPLYSLIFLVGFLGNVIAICVYTFKMRPWKNCTIIMFNLACTDLLYLSSLPFLIHYYANGEHWVFGDFMCKFIRFSFHFNLYSSILFLTCFSIFRFFAIVYPIRSLSIRKKSWIVMACVASWVVSLLAVSPVNFLITSKIQENKFLCLDLSSSENLYAIRWYTWLLSGLAFYLPLMTVTLCYAVIIHTLTNGPHTHNPYKQKARKLAFFLLLVFYVCFLPFHVLRTVRIELRSHPVGCDIEHYIHAAYIISRPLAALNTCGNLLLYTTICDNFQQAIQSLLRWKLNKSVKCMEVIVTSTSLE